MAQIKNLKPGQVIWDKHKVKAGNTTMYRFGVWPVYVKEVAEDFSYIIASWNGNEERKMYQGAVDKFRVKEPNLL